MEARFREALGRVLIPEDYLAQVESALHECVAGRWKILCLWTPVLYIRVSLKPHLRRIVLWDLITRPCAEGFGFARLALYHLSVLASFDGLELVVPSPQQHLHSLLQRAFGPLPWPVRVGWAKLADAYERLDIERDELLTPRKGRLNAESLPTAAALNQTLLHASDETGEPGFFSLFKHPQPKLLENMSLRALTGGVGQLTYQVRLSDASDTVLFQEYLPCYPGRVTYESPQLHVELHTQSGNRSLLLLVNGQRERILRLDGDQPALRLHPASLWLNILEIRDRSAIL